MSHYYKRINRALNYLNKHWQEPIKLETLAELANLSPYHFHRIFQQITGMRVQQYIQSAKLSAAAHQLSYSKKSIADIALEIGYQNQSSFGAAFHKHYKKSPGQYRKLAEQSSNTHQALLHGTIYPPEMKLFKKRELLFVHRCGDMQEIVASAWQTLINELNTYHYQQDVTEYISIAYDDPNIAQGNERYDACVSFSSKKRANGELLQKTLAGGLHAVFRYEGEHKHIHGAWLYALNWLKKQEFELSLQPGFFIHLDENFTTLLCQPLGTTH